MEGSRVLVCNGAASLLGTQSATLNTNGRLRGPWRNTATGRQTLPISGGPCSSAMCSLLINRTHSARRVGVDTKPLPLRALGFSSYLRLCQLKRLYYDANSVECCGSSSVGRGGGWRSKLVTVLLLCFLPLEIHQTQIVRLVWPSWTLCEEGRSWELTVF